MIRGARPRRPVKFSVGGENRHIVDASFAATHQAIRLEFPLLVAVCAEPVAGIVVPFVLKANRDPIFVKRPQLLDQAIVELPGPLPFEKGDDLGASVDEFGAVAPAAILGIGQ